MLAEACRLGCLGEGDTLLGGIHCIELVYNGSASSKTSPPMWSFPLGGKEYDPLQRKKN